MRQLNDLPGVPLGPGISGASGVWLGAGLLGLLAVSLAILPLLRRRSLDRQRAPQRASGSSRAQFFGNLLLATGLASMAVAAVYYVAELAGGSTVLPQPVALEAAESTPTPERAATATLAPTETPRPVTLATRQSVATPTATAVPTATSMPTPTPTPVKAGVPVRMVIKSIGVDSGVQEAGTYWENGQLLYETLPYLIAHYRMTAKVGAVGNAVFSGHVVTRNYGNVFRDLYRIRVGDDIQIYSQDMRYTYVVSSVREVLPTDVSVMEPTPDATVTLITCSGEWIPAERQYSRRLIVSAKLKSAEPLE